MIEMCSCFRCGSRLESVPLESDMLPKLSSRCSPFSFRTARSFKGLCFFTASLAFVLGIGIGVLIPLYVLPVSGDLFLRRDPATDSVILSSALGRAPLPATPSPLLSASIPDTISSRFPEFAQLQGLQREKGSLVYTKKQFQYPMLRRPSPNVQFVAPAARILSLHPVQQEIPKLNQTSLKLERRDLLEGVYWSSKVEAQLPAGFTEEDVRSWRRFVSQAPVLDMEEGCGRMQNRLLTLVNSTRACCRYRQNSDQIQGEIFSFYLSQLLGLRNLAPSALNMVQSLSPKWSSVRAQLTLAQWAEEKPVVLTQFMPNLASANIPASFRNARPSLQPIDVLLSSKGLEALDMPDLAQWSDLILFDYLTANLDRVVNNLYNLQWNPSMMEAPAHNLAKDTRTGLLVFLDNESGLLHGYRLLDKYEQYHRLMLDSLCVFRRSTATAVKKLVREKNVGKLLRRMFHSLEPALVNYLPMLPEKSVKILNRRLERVYDQITKCESLYMS